MDFLDNLVLPQSSEHIMLLHYMLILIMFLFIPFVSIVFGGTAISLFYKRKGTKPGNELHLRFARDVIETLTLTKGIGVVLGIVPVLAALLIYAQLLHTTKAPTTIFIFISLLLISVGMILIYVFRYSQSFREIFETVKELKYGDDEVNHKISQYREGNYSLGMKSGRWGFIFLFLAVWAFVTGTTSATFSDVWGNQSLISLPFSWQVLSRLIFFVVAAFALTGASIIFGFFYWEGGKKIKDDEYREFVKKNALTIAFIGAIILPLFLAINIFVLPPVALSKSVFAYGLGALLLIFVVYHLLYSITKLKSFNYGGALFFVMMLVVFSFIMHDQLAMANATKKQSLALSAHYVEYLTQLKGETATVVEVSGEEVFQRVCSACHRFDAKLVGPPYNETLSKYEGKMSQLVAYIRNPVKVDPAYPPMPNPGLKPDEAKAVAEYIMNTYQN